MTTGTGRQWLASAESNRLYSYEFDEQHQALGDFAIYDFDPSGVHLQKIIMGDGASWRANNELVIKNAESLSLQSLEVQRKKQPELVLNGFEAPQIFKPTADRPSQLSSKALREYVRSAKKRGMDVSALAVALQRKYAETAERYGDGVPGIRWRFHLEGAVRS